MFINFCVFKFIEGDMVSERVVFLIYLFFALLGFRWLIVLINLSMFFLIFFLGKFVLLIGV